MKTTIQFLDAVRARHGITSDYKLAKFLDTTQPLVSAYRTGRARLGEDMCMKIAAALELEPGYVLAAIAAERAKRTDVRKAWQSVAKKVAGAALGFVIGYLLGVLEHSGELLAVAWAGVPTMHYTNHPIIAQGRAPARTRTSATSRRPRSRATLSAL